MVTADPVVVVLGGQAERRADHRAQGEVLETVLQRHQQRQRRHRGQAAGLAAIAAGQGLLQRAAGRGGATAPELECQVDRGYVGLHGGPGEGGHDRRVVDHDRGIALGRTRTGHRSALRLDAVFLELEARGLGLATCHCRGNAEGQHRNLGEAGCHLHEHSLRRVG